MSGQTNIPQTIIVSTALAVLTIFLGYGAQRENFQVFIIAYGSLFALYGWLVFFKKNYTIAALRWYTALGIALRFALLFSVPNLSDDFYRFLWDGRLTAAGIHPFAHPPVYFIDNHIVAQGITPELFAKLNSPNYFTVYPPICQAIFWVAARICPTSLWGGTLVLKIFLLAAEIGTISLLARWSGLFKTNDQPIHTDPQPALFNPRDPRLLSVLYALNPLACIEIVGNCHFEGVMIFGLMAGIRALQQQKIRSAAIWWALAAAAKLIPLLFLPIVWRWLGWRKGLTFQIVFGLTSLLLFIPLLDRQVLANMSTSLDLYFQLFQFNGSVFYLLWKMAMQYGSFEKSQLVGPLLGISTFIGVGILAWKTRPLHRSHPGGLTLLDGMLLASFLQLTFAATVHPWYATVPLALGILTRWRFSVLWSGLIALSYSHYITGHWLDNWAFMVVEYGVLWAFLGWEWRRSIQTNKKGIPTTAGTP